MSKVTVGPGPQIGDRRLTPGLFEKENRKMTERGLYETEDPNIIAIWGFICSFIIGMPFGIIFSILGLIKSFKCNGKGRSWAIAGLVVSTIVWGISYFIIFDYIYTYYL